MLSLSAFRGRAVVLEFMDSRCTGICPLVSREFIDAYLPPGEISGWGKGIAQVVRAMLG